VIVRHWSARLDPRNVEQYVAHLDRSLKPALAALPGFVDVTIMARLIHDAGSPMSEIVVQTRWRSLESIRAFAGDDISMAVVEPAAAALFADYDRGVRHYEVID
jgi:hypothetical protein